MKQPLSQGGNPDDGSDFFPFNSLTYVFVVCRIQEYDLSQRNNASHEAFAECQIMTDRTSQQVNILDALLPRLGAIFNAVDEAVVGPGNNLRGSRRSPGGSHMGHLHGVRASISEPGQILLRQLSLPD